MEMWIMGSLVLGLGLEIATAQPRWFTQCCPARDIAPWECLHFFGMGQSHFSSVNFAHYTIVVQESTLRPHCNPPPLMSGQSPP